METKTDTYLLKILEKVKEERNLDFSQYREKVLARRVMTRVRITKRDNFEQYYAYLRIHSRELDYLMDALTINVTEFFRDSYVFDVIEEKVIPDLFAKKRRLNSNIVRIWSCACSSGEEPYSILMLITEYLKSKLADYKLSIYATDIDGQALAKAREGVYEETQFKRLSVARRALIEKYFYDVGNKRYWIREEWPAYMNFQYHDVIADIPLDHMDIILCRNLFIYLGRSLQEQIIKRFWGSLNSGGFYVMGGVESLWGEWKEKFIEYDRKARIYVKR